MGIINRTGVSPRKPDLTPEDVFACFSSASIHTKDAVIENSVTYARLIFTPTATFSVITPVPGARVIVIGNGGRGGNGEAPGWGGLQVYGTGGARGGQDEDEYTLAVASYSVGSEGGGVVLKQGGSVLCSASNGGGGGQSTESSAKDGAYGYTNNVSGVRASDGYRTLSPGVTEIAGQGGYGFGAGGGGGEGMGIYEGTGGAGAAGAVIIMVRVG